MKIRSIDPFTPIEHTPTSKKSSAINKVLLLVCYWSRHLEIIFENDQTFRDYFLKIRGIDTFTPIEHTPTSTKSSAINKVLLLAFYWSRHLEIIFENKRYWHFHANRTHANIHNKLSAISKVLLLVVIREPSGKTFPCQKSLRCYKTSQPYGSIMVLYRLSNYVYLE